MATPGEADGSEEESTRGRMPPGVSPSEPESADPLSEGVTACGTFLLFDLDSHPVTETVTMTAT